MKVPHQEKNDNDFSICSFRNFAHANAKLAKKKLIETEVLARKCAPSIISRMIYNKTKLCPISIGNHPHFSS
jgi:hypothetical protein